MKVCTCHAWRCNKPPRMTNDSKTSSKMIIICAPATMNQPALAFQLLSCLQFVLFHLGSFRTGPLKKRSPPDCPSFPDIGSPWGTPNHRHPFLQWWKNRCSSWIPLPCHKRWKWCWTNYSQKHGMNLENTRHQNTRHHVTWNTMWVAAHVRRTPLNSAEIALLPWSAGWWRSLATGPIRDIEGIKWLLRRVCRLTGKHAFWPPKNTRNP